MIGVIVPAHDEADLLPGCLAGLRRAAAHPGVGEPVCVVVAADSCSDSTAELARAAGAEVVELNRRCAGAARRAASARALELGADWLASTDADSTVRGDWLAQQQRWRGAGWDGVRGIVEVHDWSDHSQATADAFRAAYVRTAGHPHVHGASLGVTASAYTAVGGWGCLPAHEDVALMASLKARGFRIAASASMVVRTSARRDARARGGFGDYLANLTRPTA